jgi:2-polyprenyl-3-methyl-5-hydroxy-6-metoxy-1,4-benzoquinol methylase
MTTPAQAAQPSPERIFETLTAFQETAALRAAIELDVFTAIGAGATTAAALAERCGASERGARILCDYLTVLGFLTKSGGRYALTPDSAVFLDRRSPACMASVSQFIGSPAMVERFAYLAGAVRKGGTTLGDDAGLAPEHPMWVDFAKGMAPMMIFPAEQIATLLGAAAGKPWKVLDIAAGHGMFGITIAKHNPHAEVVAVDWAPVLEVAKSNAQAAGVAPRYRTLPGSAFDVEFGAGYDVVLLTNFLHHFGPAENETLLRKVHAALKPGGRAATLEFVPNEDRVTPPIPAKFSLTMLAGTHHGEAFTFPEYEKMFRNAGFSLSTLHPLSPSPEHVIVSVK